MIRLSQLTLRRGARPLLEGAEVALTAGDRIGLIGANGSGKSSLFALLRGELHADKGEVDYPARWRVAPVAQETPALERPALEYAIDGDTTLRELETKLAAAEAANDGHLIGELHAAMGDADAYTVRSRAEQLLHGLGFTHEQMGEPVASFSGGWRMRLNLAEALMAPSDLVLLDEPTNPLDLDAILWLEEWLKRYTGTLLIVSHDRDFLDGVVDVVMHIDARKLKRYSGNYSSFERQRAAAVVLAAAQYEKQQRERAHLESFIDRFRAKATKARQAQSRMKMLEKMEELAPLHVSAPFSVEVREQDLRNYLGMFNFPGDMATGSIENFSGGEKARLALALIVWQRPNLLLLDEPTNHLDLETREALTVALAQFEGTLVLVSHDRHLLRATTEQFLIVVNGAVQAFDGDLDDYREWLMKRKVDVPREPRGPAAKRVARPASKNTLQSRIERLEQTMDKLNAPKSAIETQLGDPAVYADQEKLKALLLDRGYIGKELDSLESAWLEKQAQLEQDI